MKVCELQDGDIAVITQEGNFYGRMVINKEGLNYMAGAYNEMLMKYDIWNDMEVRWVCQKQQTALDQPTTVC